MYVEGARARQYLAAIMPIIRLARGASNSQSCSVGRKAEQKGYVGSFRGGSRISETLETEILPSGVDRESLGFSAFGVTDRCFFAEFAGLKKSKLCKMTFP